MLVLCCAAPKEETCKDGVSIDVATAMQLQLQCMHLICIAFGMRQHACLRLDPPMPRCASRPCSVHHTSLLLLPLLLQ
jgi:hypothetical protein